MNVVKIRALLFFILYFIFSPIGAQSWPEVKNEAKPGARWWWLGSAVDKENLQWNIKQYADHGIGSLEITPLYGVQGNRANNIPYLSDKWLSMLRYTQEQCKANGIELDMATGTGWPFGGPWVPLEESACRVIFVERDVVKGTTPDFSLTGKDAVNSKLDLHAFGNLLTKFLVVFHHIFSVHFIIEFLVHLQNFRILTRMVLLGLLMLLEIILVYLETLKRNCL